VKAAMRDRYGPPKIVRIEEVEKPVPTGDQVLVRVRAASVNRADLDGLAPRWRFTRLFFGLRTPRIRRLGLDAAGVVEAVGPETSRFKPGDRVFADLFAFGMGAFAEYVCARERAFAPMPAGMSFEDAATLPHSAVLAVQGLRTHSGRTPRPGDAVMVVGASGNVGPFAVQIAKALGTEVTGVSRTDKLDFVRSLGADHVIDYTRTDYTRSGPYDWIVDVDAKHPLRAFRRTLRPGGVYVAMGGSTAWLLSSLIQAPFLRLTGRRMGLLLGWVPFKAADVDRVKELIAQGKLKPAIDRRFSLDQIVDALRYVEEGRPRGKVVITV
jgi:NADPH:quinone reductase-like Zn-dependent oxidoreductase